MPTAKRWSVDIFISETDRTTHAEASLRTNDATEVRGVGVAHRNPHDRDVPEVGDELAVARALGDLSRHLLSEAVGDIEALSVEQADTGT
ncbi:MAG TPA: DUF1876 domain-containing protein [Nocardioidaceae bacterium]|nr:DUF1876 domain-containing protein [Nocardioidaceae bacterium]